MTRRKKIFAFILAMSIMTVMGYHVKDTLGNSPTPEDFAQVPVESRPWCYYWWLKGNITPEQITHDLEQMRAKGFGGILLFDSRRYYDEYDSREHVPVPLHIKHEFMSPGWRQLVVHTVREAARLGMKVSMNIADSGGVLRGPWDLGNQGPKELIWTEENVNGPKKISLDLPIPQDKKFYRDVAFYAVKIQSAVSPGREIVKLNKTWGNASVPNRDAAIVSQSVDVTPLAKDGKLTWNVPDGNWKIIRFGCHVVGEVGSVDILNRDAITSYYDRMCGQIIKDVGDLAGKTLTHFYNVSWEGSNPDWTYGFEKEFQARRQYDLHEMMPVLRGLILKDWESSIRFTRDYYKTVSDCFRENCYKTIGELCHRQGMIWHSEDGGPWRRTAPIFREADMLSFWGQNDIPQGEFWVPGTHLSNLRCCSMAAHIYGHKETAAEAFTHMTYHWTMSPAKLKPHADRNFIDGMTKVIWHTFTASPLELGKPGFEYFAGTHINTNVTWWDKTEGILAYLGRCQYMLTQGEFAADVCAYVSDKNYLTWGRAKKWNEKSKLALNNGYTYDLLDTNVLVNHMKYENGRLVLPHGMSYRLLVLDPLEETLPAEAIEKIEKLVREGAVVVLGEKKPVANAGLTNHDVADKKLAAAVATLWSVPPKEKVRTLGKGRIYYGASMNEVFQAEKILPDCDAPFEWTHRIVGDSDLYFITGKGTGQCRFRSSGKSVELWNPLDGSVTPIESVSDGKQVTIPLTLTDNGSVFVVIRPEESKIVKQKAVESLPARNLDGPWNVSFDPKWGGPQNIVFDKLSLWNENEQFGIKYYSGTARYRKTIELSAKDIDACPVLDLGSVFDIVRVRLNGKDLGVVWTHPWSVSLTSAAKTGKNELEIEVTNCWANRLIGDSGLPNNDRLTKTSVYRVKERGKLRPYQGFASTDKLLPSGLIGPVRLTFGSKP